MSHERRKSEQFILLMLQQAAMEKSALDVKQMIAGYPTSKPREDVIAAGARHLRFGDQQDVLLIVDDLLESEIEAGRKKIEQHMNNAVDMSDVVSGENVDGATGPSVAQIVRIKSHAPPKTPDKH